MFSSFSAYLFGSSSNVEDDCEKENEFTTVETDGDWLIVNSSKQDDDSIPDENGAHHQPLKATNHKLLSDDESADYAEALQYPPKMFSAVIPFGPKNVEPWLYDSWFITPPSCFTASPHSFVQTSPLENLLIEHPSMSVYAGYDVIKKGKGMGDSEIKNAIQSSNDSSSHDKRGLVFREFEFSVLHLTAPAVNSRLCIKERLGHRPSSCASGKAELMEQIKNEAGVQKVKHRQEAKFIHGKQLERHNKAQEFQSIGKRHRRKNFMKNPSGKSNNRKY